MDLHGFVSHHGDMFTPYCDQHQSTVLLGYESVVGIESTPIGVKVLLRCYCGELLVHDTINRNAGLASAQA